MEMGQHSEVILLISDNISIIMPDKSKLLFLALVVLY